MEFEFDEAKSRANEAKHGTDFVRAQGLWLDEDRAEVTARTGGEPRSIVIGRLEGKYWSAVVTYRGERVRVISVRRSRAEEVAIYEDG